MQFTAVADIHIHSKVPKNRKGDYLQQVIDKFEFILKTAEKTDSRILVVAGDFFDTARAKYKVTNKILKLLQKYKEVKVLVIAGQHDLNYHTGGLDNTPLGILETSKAVTILRPDSITNIDGISFIGCSWNEIPEMEADVLVIHKMIVKKEPLWPGQTNYSTSYSILRKYPWSKVIISGDNHLHHTLRTKDNRIQINCGSIMRSTKSQIEFQPRVYQVDSLNWKIKSIKIPCLLPEEVFDFSKITIEEMKEDYKKEAEEKIASFISTLPKNQQEKPNFQKILSNVVENTKPNKDVKNIINKLMEEIS